MENVGSKRRASPAAPTQGDNKKFKGKKKWDMPRRKVDMRAIQPGDMGIWATCAMKKEAKSIVDLQELFQDYATKLYATTSGANGDNDDDDDSEEGDIEEEIKKELADIRKPTRKPLFSSVKLDTQCLIFFRTRLPVEPVSFVHTICQDIANGTQPRNLRYVKRLTPITAYEKATTQGLEAVAKRVLAPHFHGSDQAGKKFAIRPSIRNNKQLTRSEVIDLVAGVVGLGRGHKVDLHGYDLLILVEIYQNVVGMSVVGSDFEELKRYNLEELRVIVPEISAEPKAEQET